MRIESEQTGRIKTSAFQAPRWLKNAHAQTLFANRLRRLPKLAVTRERLHLPDGDFNDIDWAGPLDAPIVILLHGLAGCSQSPYMLGMMHALAGSGLRSAALHFRGCSGEANRLPISYHSGFTRDLDYFITVLRQRYGHRPLAAVGYSLGGNVLLKWLGETQNASALGSAVAVSVPFNLAQASRVLDTGIGRVYGQALLHELKRSLRDKFQHIPPPFALPRLNRLNTFYAFDDQITAPLHGFSSAMEYYQRCSNRQFLCHIRTPTLILHAVDDPMMTPAVIPTAAELSRQVSIELSEHGGHVGFVGGSLLKPDFWLEQRIPAYLREHLRDD